VALEVGDSLMRKKIYCGVRPASIAGGRVEYETGREMNRNEVHSHIAEIGIVPCEHVTLPLPQILLIVT
jgi:hypothetical protein